MHKRPTMKDVAELANVSQPTVSYVLNNSAKITDTVKARVWAAIETLQYRPNNMARTLKTNQSNTIGILIPDISNSYYAQMMNTFTSVLRRIGKTAIVSTTSYDPHTEVNDIGQLLSNNVDAIIVAFQLRNPESVHALQQAGVPVVIVEGQKVDKAFGYIGTDNYFGGYEATRVLLDQGLTKVVYIDQSGAIAALEARREGYRQAMIDAGLAQSIDVITTEATNDKWQAGLAIGKAVVQKRPEGVIASSDIIAAGILRTLFINKLKVPEDIQVIGYDDIPLAKVFVPAISTMAQPIEAVCNATVKALVENNEQNKLTLIDQNFRPTFVARETTTRLIK